MLYHFSGHLKTAKKLSKKSLAVDIWILQRANIKIDQGQNILDTKVISLKVAICLKNYTLILQPTVYKIWNILYRKKLSRFQYKTYSFVVTVTYWTEKSGPNRNTQSWADASIRRFYAPGSPNPTAGIFIQSIGKPTPLEMGTVNTQNLPRSSVSYEQSQQGQNSNSDLEWWADPGTVQAGPSGAGWLLASLVADKGLEQGLYLPCCVQCD